MDSLKSLSSRELISLLSRGGAPVAEECEDQYQRPLARLSHAELLEFCDYLEECGMLPAQESGEAEASPSAGNQKPAASPLPEPPQKPDEAPKAAQAEKPAEKPTTAPTSSPNKLAIGQPSGQASKGATQEPSPQPLGGAFSEPLRQPSGQPAAHPAAHPGTGPGDGAARDASRGSSEQAVGEAPKEAPVAVPAPEGNGRRSGDPVARLEKELEALRDKLHDAEVRLSDMRRSRDLCRQELEASQATLSGKIGELCVLRTRLEEQNREMEELRKRPLARSSENAAEVEALRMELKIWMRKADEAMEAQAAMRQENEALRRQLEEAGAKDAKGAGGAKGAEAATKAPLPSSPEAAPQPAKNSLFDQVRKTIQHLAQAAPQPARSSLFDLDEPTPQPRRQAPPKRPEQPERRQDHNEGNNIFGI